MHDPDTLAFTIPYPWWRTRKSLLKGKDTERCHDPFITIWHHDPEVRGNDDSCGWFMRAWHGDKAVLAKIEKRFDWDWDRTFTSDSSGKTYFCGYFYPEYEGAASNHLSVLSIGLNLFFLAALEHFGGSRKKAIRFVQQNLFEIMLFTENPFDSLSDSITQKFGHDTKREDRIHNLAACIYGWILRETRPWYKHPRWHVWHWRLQIHPWQTFKRCFLERCCKCGKGFRRNEGVIGNWAGTQIWHDRCDDTVKTPTQSN